MQRTISADRTAALLGDAADRSPAYLSIAHALRLLVSDGRIPSGTRLPSERELTNALGVSRTTVTRAYTHLRELGYVDSRRGSGSVVRLPSPRSAGDTLLSPGPAGGDHIDLTCAAPTAPTGVAAAYEWALGELPCHLTEHGYYPSGLPILREAIAERYSQRGLPTDPDQLLITSGAQAGLAVVVRAFVGSGDRVLMESPTYPNAIATLRGARARVHGADVGQRGWATASLLDSVVQVRPSAAYLMPDFHNPTGLLMSDDERARLASALRRAGVLPIVDETLAEMAIDEVVPALPFAAHAPGTISVGSASKAFWGGLRIGWVRVPSARMADLVTARLSLDLGTPLVEQLALVHLMARRDSILQLRRAQLREARSALMTAVAAELPSWRWSAPAGGLSLWCELPRPAASRLVATAAEHGVRIAPGPMFAPEGGLERFVRLPFTVGPDQLSEAVTRLARAWEHTSDQRGRRSRRQDPALVT
jgi:DNA-binding transcriptional MocR family regulator